MIHEVDPVAAGYPAGPPLAPPTAPPTVPLVGVAPAPEAADPTRPVSRVTEPSAPWRESTAPSDAELLAAARRDPAAFRAFYDRWSEPVLGYFQRRIGDPQVALDLTAETFATVFEKRTSLRWRASSPSAWLFGIARNLVRRYFRTQAIQRRAIDRLGVALPAYDDLALRRVEELVDNEAMRRLVHSALAQAKEGDRRVLELRFVNGLPYDEVARRLGCSVNAARVRCHRALTRLEKQLEQERTPLPGPQRKRP